MYRYIFKILLSACIFAGVLIKFNTRNKTVVATLKSVCYNKLLQQVSSNDWPYDFLPGYVNEACFTYISIRL